MGRKNYYLLIKRVICQEKWNNAVVNVNIGEPVIIPKKDKEESKHDYDERCLNYLMKSIAKGLPEKYRGVYK